LFFTKVARTLPIIKHHFKLRISITKKAQCACIALHPEREREREGDYVPGTTASIHGWAEAEGGCVVVS